MEKHKSKTHLTITLYFLVMILGVFVFAEGFRCFSESWYIKYNSFHFNETTYDGIYIPRGVNLYFTKVQLKSVMFGDFGFGDSNAIGLFNVRDKDIFIDDSLNIDSKASVLAHELGHYQYYYILNSSQKKDIEDDYEFVCGLKNTTLYECENADEFYAWVSQRGWSKSKIK